MTSKTENVCGGTKVFCMGLKLGCNQLKTALYL